MSLNILTAEIKTDSPDKEDASRMSHQVPCFLPIFTLHGFPRPVADSEPGEKLQTGFTLHLAVQLAAR